MDSLSEALRGRAAVTPGLPNRLLGLFSRLAPRRLTTALAGWLLSGGRPAQAGGSAASGDRAPRDRRGSRKPVRALYASHSG